MPRTTNPALDALIDGPAIQVHEHGFIRVVDYMGDDAAIVQAARVSYGAGTKTARDDEALIRYLMRHDHTSPAEMPTIRLHIKAPIFVARQWFRTRMASRNEMSGRYSILPSEFYIPSIDAICKQATDNKQGRGAAFSQFEALGLQSVMRRESSNSFKAYDLLISQGVAREIARMVLPLNTYTEWHDKIDIHNLLNFLEQRLHPHAQQEIRDYASVLAGIVAAWCPMAWRAFWDFRLNAVTLSAQQVEALRAFVGGDPGAVDALPKRERADLEAMLRVGEVAA